MRRIIASIVLTLSTLLLVSVTSAQQTPATSKQTATLSVRSASTTTVDGGPDTVINCVGAQNGRIAVFTQAAPPNITLCNSGIYEAAPYGTGAIGILNPNPLAALDVNGATNTSLYYQIGGSTVLYTGDPSLRSVFVGQGAGGLGSGGNENSFVGNLAGNSNSTGGGNSFFGYQAGVANLSGGDNSFFGVTAGSSNTSGDYNSFLGSGAGFMNTTGQNNSFFGNGAGFSNTTGSLNVSVGAHTGGSDNPNGNDNVFVGAYAGNSNTSGGGNTIIGFSAGLSNTTGSYNVFYGNSAGNFNTTGSNNVYIAAPGIGSENNTIRIGSQGNGQNQQNAAYIVGIYGSTSSGGIPVYINAGGQLGTSSSSLRFKEQVRDMGDSTDALMKLRPVTFLYKPEYDKGERTLQYGLIAEEVAKVYPELVAYDNDGQPYTVRYQYLTTMLLNEVQKQYHRAEVQAEVIQTQQQEIDSLQQQLQVQNATLQERLSRLEALARVEVATAAK